MAKINSLQKSNHGIELDEEKILIAQLEVIQEETRSLESKISFMEEHQSKICDAIRRLGKEVDPSNILGTHLSIDEWGTVLDEVSEKKNCLIRPSHSLQPYSLIHIKEKLKEHVPAQIITDPLDILRYRATCRATEIIIEQTTENTIRAYEGDLVYWQAWLSAIGFTFKEPIKLEEVITFIIQHSEGVDHELDQKLVEQGFKNKLGPHKLATIKRRVASLSIFLDQYKLPNPCREKDIKDLLIKLTKKYGGSKPSGRAITKDILDDMIETCGDKLIDIRDKALLLFAWGSGGRRRSEVVAAEIANLTETPEGNFTYKITHSKTDQTEKGVDVPLQGRVAYALKQWIVQSGISEGSLFRAVLKGGRLGKKLSDVDVYRIVKRRLKLADYDEKHFGAHSLRSGFVTEAGRRGKPLGDVMALTTHKSVNTVMKYYQAGNVNNNSASNLADEK